jgi:hypothetical protein
MADRTLPGVAGAVRLDEFLDYLRRNKRLWPVKRIAKLSGVRQSVVYRALKGGNVTKKTLCEIASVFGGELLVTVKPGANKLAVDG